MEAEDSRHLVMWWLRELAGLCVPRGCGWAETRDLNQTLLLGCAPLCCAFVLEHSIYLKKS